MSRLFRNGSWIFVPVVSYHLIKGTSYLIVPYKAYSNPLTKYSRSFLSNALFFVCSACLCEEL